VDELVFDVVGYWTELKIEILQKYAAAYSTILTKNKFWHAYIDAFCGRGVHISRTTYEFIEGSPLSALAVEPPFDHFFFIDIEGKVVEQLRQIVGGRDDVSVFHEDANGVLVDSIFPQIRFDLRRRALCFLDPRGMHWNWEVLEAAGQAGTIDLFVNFPVMAMNRRALWRDPDRVSENSIQRMNRFWGDDSWRKIVYRKRRTLFGDEDVKEPNEVVVEAFRDRLRKVAGFRYVSEALPMRNDQGGVIYYLILAAPVEVATTIMNDIFRKYRERS